MQLTHMSTNEVIILRLQETTTDKMAMTTITSIFAEVQSVDDDKSQLDDGVFGKTYILYSDGKVSIYAGDQLRDNDGRTFTVKSGGATNRQHGRIGFSKVILEQTK